MSSAEEPSGTAGGASFTWRFGDVEVDEATRELKVRGIPVDIEPRPFDLLLLLMRRAGEVVSNEEIIATTWAGRLFNEASVTNVSNTVSKLRKLLKDDRREIIKTVPKIGYRFMPATQRHAVARSALVSTLERDQAVPGRLHWRLTEKLDGGGYGDTWIATNTKTREQRVFKFCSDNARLSALKREATLFRILRETLGDRAPVPALLEWQFETPPFYTEAERWGQDLASWAQQAGGLQQLSLDTRLTVMTLIAEAVAAMHSVGVLHKDLKPRNILLRQEGDALQVRLCDLGSGLLLDLPEVDALGITRMGFTQTTAHAGTPTYTAPELQAGGAPSIQSDIYSLGVLLYQLVVGDWRPVAFGWEADVDDELLQQDITLSIHRDPDRRPPSARLIAQQIHSLPDRRKQYEHEREMERKNAALKETLERERARRPWIIAAAGVFLIALGVSSALLLQARRAARLATENEHIARSVANFISNDILRQSVPDYGGRVDVTLKAAVTNSIPKISERLVGSASVAAELNQSLAEYLASTSNLSGAAKLAHEAAELYEELYGATDRRTLSATVDEYSYRVHIEPPTTLIPAFRAFEPNLSSVPDTDPIILRVALINVRLALMEGRDESAIPILEEALSRFPAPLSGEDQRSLDETKLAYARYLTQNARYDDAKEQARSLMPQLKERYGAKSRLTLDLHRTLGRAYMANRADSHDFAAAEAELRTAVDGFNELYGSDSSEATNALMDLGDFLITSKRWAEAEPIERRLIADFERHYGSDSVWTWRSRISLLAALNGLAASHPEYIRPAIETANDLMALARDQLSAGYLYRRVLVVVAYSLIAAKRDAEADRLLAELDTMRGGSVTGDAERNFLEGQANYLRGLLALLRGDEHAASEHLTLAVERLTEFGADKQEVTDARARLAALTAR